MQHDEPIQTEIVHEASALEAVERANVDQQIATAKRYPRDATSFLRRAETMIGEDPKLAGECGYELTRGRKTIVGPSVRLAEIALLAWGNARVQVLEEPYTPNRDRTVRAYAIFHDLESNVAVRVPKVRRTVDRHGRPFGDDMMATTMNATISLAYRDAVLRGIPRHYITKLWSRAMAVAAGKIADMATARRETFAAFAKVGVPQERLLASLGLEGPEGLTIEHIGALRAVYRRISTGEIRADQAFPVSDEAAPAKAAEQAVVEGRKKAGRSPKAPARPKAARPAPAEPEPEEGPEPPDEPPGEDMDDGTEPAPADDGDLEGGI